MPTAAPKPTSTGPRYANTGNKDIHPPKGRKVSCLPIRTYDEFVTAHHQDAERLQRYVDTNRAGSKRPGPAVMQFMEPRYAPYLRANNAYARIAFVEPLLRYVREHVSAPDDQLLFVTITPRAYILPIATAANVDFDSLKAFSRQAVDNSNGIGMVEAALYRNCDAYGPRYGTDVIAWHTHMIVWGKTHTQLRAIADRLGPRHVNISGRKAVWIKSITSEELSLYALYLAKTPLKYYRLTRCRGETVDDSTGEVFENCRQNKDRMRPCDTVRVANLMHDLFLHDLVFGSGAGTPIVRELLHEVTALHRKDEERDQIVRLMRHMPRGGFA